MRCDEGCVRGVPTYLQGTAAKSFGKNPVRQAFPYVRLFSLTFHGFGQAGKPDVLILGDPKHQRQNVLDLLLSAG
jgi:hypothetical protein